MFPSLIWERITCNLDKVLKYKQNNELTKMVQDKLLKSKLETTALTMRNIYCPFCGYLVEKVFSDISGHKQVYCKKCKEEYIINLGYFRRQRRLKRFKIVFPENIRFER